MKSTGERVKEVLAQNVIKDKDKLEKQMKYYKKLTKKGIAKKQTYSLKTISII